MNESLNKVFKEIAVDDEAAQERIAKIINLFAKDEVTFIEAEHELNKADELLQYCQIKSFKENHDNDVASKLTTNVKVVLSKHTKKALNELNESVKQLSEECSCNKDLNKTILNKVHDIDWWSTNPNVHKLCDEIVTLLSYQSKD